ncbi:GH36-type glycosyl hydrolase domain-containing protein [Paenibacillus crassostreae]|uniref:Cellobiose phosphorylase n=1 Tax=Paenibacillus crassostreae TaxID=1763538 RepID=A0A162N843_9BACL|nr:cellobiose phosphorylase [Paenibacillus crassostreae]AOZ93698.1 cellobiose phosphorylase [Paenibacillus crassostreae]OAB71392.1 cellobiose phosphorylase [Paenibacillus crassostreae]
MVSKNDDLLTLEVGSLTFRFLSSGDLYQATYGGLMINQWLSNSIDGSLNNIYLRLHDDELGIQAYPLLGVNSQSRVRKLDDRLVFEGEVAEIRYQVMFTPTDKGIWFWDVKIEGNHNQIDLIYGQDIGIANEGAVRSNEAYLSQYIDHTVFDDERNGYVVCCRQNQPQSGVFPYIQQGSLTRATSFSTDGFQFYGLSYKETNVPECLTQDTLANEIYQYEFAYTALQSECIQLDGEARFVFYGICKEDHPTAISTLEYSEEVAQARKAVEKLNFDGGELLNLVSLLPSIGVPLHTEVLNEAELNRLFPNRHQEEVEGNDLLAFFTDGYEHVVLKEKELRVERPHGHILMSGDNVSLKNPVMTTTSYMYGIFNSQVVVGNTNFNKMTTNARNALNVPKTSGQRIYVEIDEAYRLLTMPSVFEMGFNYVRWYYKTKDDLLIITNFTTVDTPEVRLNVRSEQGKSYRFLVSNQITMNVNEYEVPYHIRDHGEYLSFHADPASLSADIYPALEYRIHLTGSSMKVSDERKFVSHIARGDASLTVLELDVSSEWTMTFQGLLNGGEMPLVERKAEEEIERYREFFRSVMNGFHLSTGTGDENELFKVNGLAWWYTHNMLVHYSVPHGLEQYGGAAWGTRDVCQGPVEYFMATHKYDQVRATLLTIFSHQYEDDGNWPQWFMFDKYTKVQQEESHGDIIVWPLKVLGDYLNVTRDYSILEEHVPYTSKHSFDITTETATILEHAYKEIDYIKNHFLHGTHLSSYGDGDWDDTLQPANAQLKQYMVSSWTVALTYQTLNQFAQVMEVVDPVSAVSLQGLADGIQKDFNHYMLQTEVIPGFLYMESPEQVKLMVHPSDTETGIQYRLLPMTRSMISELLSPEQAATHYDIIREQFVCPDGVRLMNRPAQYVGGVSTHFKRAEQAANFGREIGLQYVHAHIRYVEAMAKLGKEDDVWSGLARINPIGIKDVIPNAELRQSNAYFSSSDGKFNTRYEAQERFDELRSGKVPVKGGWKIYSSGPGIYMNQLISNALGIRQEAGDLIIDPVLPQTLDGLRFDFEYAGAQVKFVYHLISGDVHRVSVNGQDITTETTMNRYRVGGLRIARKEFDRVRSEKLNIVEIFM